MRPKPFLLERYFALHEFTAPWLLCSSDCESITLGDLLDMAPGSREKFEKLWLGYTESTGSPELREAISGLYSQMGPDQILVHAGAQEAILNFMCTHLRPGDHMVVMTPCYQSLSQIALDSGVQVSPWFLRTLDNGTWDLSLEDLKSLLRPETKAVVVNFPHNPTGYLPDLSLVTELCQLSQTRGFTIFSDEVYRGLEQDRTQRLPMMADLCPGAVSLGVMSKSFGLAGLRIGWVASSNKELLREMAAFKDYTTICSSAPSEFLSTLALSRAEELMARNREIISSNLNLLDSFFSRHEDRFIWRRPLAGPIAFPGLRHEAAEEFCSATLKKSGVLLLPGNLYGDFPQARTMNSFRMGFGRVNLPQALEHFEAFI